MAKVAHLKEPEKEGKREPVYFATHADYVEGLNDKLDTRLDTKLEEQEIATTTTDGLMSATDKVKLAGITENANNYSLPTRAVPQKAE